ncbi:hypothetical protein [Rhodovulum adriaticum]|uniref:Uncharacterized protein n=1 Tax=Rhodovulum adriaticum TaxID=35804 RepID=A0A4R2NZJ0_RHOAD|nr:hypothetical protein [Rhodovulum adriaticum]MBK1635327.1 hypothetical protein [Rhodovulum adriaticum]TCP27739.1 hypothetical protein EV656_101649 [Rhodovulum adriaticum]
MISRVIGAAARTAFVVLVIAMPSLLLPGATGDVTQIVALLCLFAGALTFFEYVSTYPGLVEFRDAPPFNRIRFAALFFTVLALTLICKGQFAPNALTLFVEAVGAVIAQATDFEYSPVRLFIQLLPAETNPAHVILVRNAAGIAYLISLISLGVFVLASRLKTWPSRNGAFNVWVNLPTFDPTAAGDVVERLHRDGRINIAMGFILPFVIPLVMRAGSSLFDPVLLDNPHTLIWTVSAWALLPASLFMRGIALGRISEMIRRQRGRTRPADAASFVPV